MVSMDTTHPGLPASPAPPAPIQSGPRIPGFAIEQTLGAGAAGRVYRARQASSDRVVALKLLPRDVAQRKPFVERFYDETTAVLSLQHPNIAAVIDRGHAGQAYYLVTELVHGPTLADPSTRDPGAVQLLHIGMGVASALTHAHARGVVHGNIRPANIMMSRHGAVKVTDFDLARLTAIGTEPLAPGAGPPTDAAVDALAYAAPEQIRDAASADDRADIYALGVVLYELATQRRPISAQPTPPSEISAAADPRMDPILTRCLQLHPDDRYQAATELLADLEALSWSLQAAPDCPGCAQATPVRAERCPLCDRDLAALFDACPGCKRSNRVELHRCLYCDQDLVSRRTTVGRKIALMLDSADDLCRRERFDQALQTLREVRHLEAHASEEQRRRAESLRHATLSARRRAASERFVQARSLARRGAFGQSIALLKSISPDLRDTTREIEALCRRRRSALAHRRVAILARMALLIAGIIAVILTLILVLQ
jgi:protein kinase-like protein